MSVELMVKLWDPQLPATLRGVFEFRERANWAVRAEDGTLWLLRPEAEEQLIALDPDAGQDVQVMHIKDDADGSRFLVSVNSRVPDLTSLGTSHGSNPDCPSGI